MKRRTFTLGLAGALGTSLHGVLRAAEALTLPGVVTLVAPFAAGGGADQLAREFANFAQTRHPGTTFIVENKPGANGAIAARYVARAKPDGATLLLGTSSTHALGPLLSREDRDIAQAFSPVTLLASTANALAVPANSPYRTLDEFLAAARREERTYGTFGAGSSAHLYGLVLARSAGAQLAHVPYKGSSQAITDLLGGHIDAAFLTTNALEALAREGKVRVLAVTGNARTRILPNVPTFEEQGVRHLDFSGWFALFAPLGTPAPLRDAVAGIAREVTQDATVSARLAGQGYDWVGSDPAALQAAYAATVAIYERILREHPELQIA